MIPRRESELIAVLCDLLEWAKGNRGSKHNNPYSVPEVKAALKIISAIQGGRDWMEAKTAEGCACGMGAGCDLLK